MGEREDLRCCFCNKRQVEVRKLIAGPKVFIRDECVEVCVQTIGAEGRMAPPG
jgi:ATP-dependent Clp protease ATP-binding subunit ClpX